ncbi:hypothetical protein ACJMK2_005783 [Sinanodonta woodiana]|uniref:Uncharacterized protein n=1 Tax=Sinanodonta woodiana TaxID=1069815 RepID=A0ABD3VR67_SINWO
MSSINNIPMFVLVLSIIISCCQATNKVYRPSNRGGVNAGPFLPVGGWSGDGNQLPTGGGVFPGTGVGGFPSSVGNLGLPGMSSVGGFPGSSNLVFPQSNDDQFLFSNGDVFPGTQFGSFRGVAGGISPGTGSSGLPGLGGGFAGSRNFGFPGSTGGSFFSRSGSPVSSGARIVSPGMGNSGVFPGGTFSGIASPMLPVSGGGSLIGSGSSGFPGFGGAVMPAMGGNQVFNGNGGGLNSGIGGIFPAVTDDGGILPGSLGVPSYQSVDDFPLIFGANTKGTQKTYS